MLLYHFTAGEYLAGIARHGLTVGDVPTDLELMAGRVGVWLTTSEFSHGHGLSGSALNKGRYRLTVELSRSACKLHHWTDWAASNATEATVRALGRADGAQSETWWVCFDVIHPSAIISCRDMLLGKDVSSWCELTGPGGRTLPGVPAWRRAAWHKALLKSVVKALAARRRLGSREQVWPGPHQGIAIR